MKKGFTLIEIIAVIVLIALVTLMVVPAIVKQVQKEGDTVNQVTLNLIYEGTDSYVKENYHTYKQVAGNVYCIPLQTLVNNKVLDKTLKDYKTNKPISLSRVVKASVNSYNEFEYTLLSEKDSCETVDNDY